MTFNLNGQRSVNNAILFHRERVAKRIAGLRGGASVLNHNSFNVLIHPCKTIFQSEGEQGSKDSNWI